MKTWDVKPCMSIEDLKRQLNAVEEAGGVVVQVLPGWNATAAMIVYYTEQEVKRAAHAQR